MPALDGILVIALEQAVSAPFCTQRLADAGARVIKIERKEGDFARRYDDVVQGESAYFAWLNRGKQSLTLDIKSPDDAALLDRLLAKADIFVQNLAPGATSRAGFDTAKLRARHPRLITCDISGYGNHGPAREMKAYDLLIQCETGLASITGTADGPGRVGVSVADIGCGMNAHAAILQALYERQRTSQGRAISVSLFDTLAEWMTVPLLHHDYANAAPARVGLKHPSIAPYGAFDCADGTAIVIAIQNEREWQALCEHVLLQPDLAMAEGFATNALRTANREILEEVLGEIFAALPHDEAVRRLAVANVAYASVNQVSDLSCHPHLRRVAVTLPGGAFEMPAPLANWQDISCTGGSVPTIGSHAAAIREEFA